MGTARSGTSCTPVVALVTKRSNSTAVRMPSWLMACSPSRRSVRTTTVITTLLQSCTLNTRAIGALAIEPRCGEIDIIESVGCTQDKVYGTIHTQAYNHMHHTEKSRTMDIDGTEWHTYSIDWTEAGLTWFVDGESFHRFAPSAKDVEKWPFDQEFYLILNVAVGGSWGGMCVHNAPSCSTDDEFGPSQVMQVDFARVYEI